MDYKIVSASSVSDLNKSIADYISIGYVPIGGHQVVIVFEQLRFSGSQHHSTSVDREYSQAMYKK